MPRLLRQPLLWLCRATAAIALCFVISTQAAFAEPPILTAPEAAQKLNAGEMVVLDIRSPEEWKDSGVAAGVWPVSMHTPDFPRQLQTILAKYGPDQIGLICATGGRSAYVAEILEKNGIPGVADVSEAMFGNGTGPGWIARGLPVVSAEDALAQFKIEQDTWE